jgi:hypothetical protein
MLTNTRAIKTTTVVIAGILFGGVGKLLGLKRRRGQLEKAISFYSTAYINSNL